MPAASNVVLFEEHEAVMLVPRSTAVVALDVEVHSIGVVLVFQRAVTDVAVSLAVRAHALALC